MHGAVYQTSQIPCLEPPPSTTNHHLFLDVHLAANTVDKTVFNNALDSLSAHGGGDSPEYSLSGILLGLETCEPGSKMFVFTDAAAKDSFQKETVLALAQAKEIKVGQRLYECI